MLELPWVGENEYLGRMTGQIIAQLYLAVPQREIGQDPSDGLDKLCKATEVTGSRCKHADSRLWKRSFAIGFVLGAGRKSPGVRSWLSFKVGVLPFENVFR